MTDIVERLRKDPTNDKNWSVMMEAAAYIERLRAAIREALDLLSDGPGGPRRLTAIKIIGAALEQSTGNPQIDNDRAGWAEPVSDDHSVDQ